MVYFNKKAQTLTELATFGSILLLVLSFLISYGIRYNYQQNMQMAAFRRALSEAYVSGRPDASASVVMVEDKHIPDPRDMFGAGNIVPVQASAEVTWGNTMQDEYVNFTDYSRIKYVINGVEKEYTTEAYVTIYKTIYSGFYADVLDQRRFIEWANVTCYQPTSDSPKQARVSLGDNNTELISSIYLPLLDKGEIVAGKIIEQSLSIVGVVPSTANDGDPIDGFDVRTPQGGMINPYFTRLNQNTGEFNASGDPIYVTADNMQGLLLDAEQNIRRRGTLTIEEAPGTSASTAAYSFKDKAGNPTTITHKIRTNSGVSLPAKPTPIISPFERNRISEWKLTK